METKCGSCGRLLGPFESIDVAGEGTRCYPCFNRETADRLGLVFDEPWFQPIVVADADGAEHTFTIRSMLVPTGHEMEAIEMIGKEAVGYRFALLGGFEADPWELFHRLYATMRREVGIRHVQRTKLGWQLTDHQRLTGRIEWDSDSDNRMPMIVIDGKPFTWEQVGHMLMTFEGFTLEARIRDTVDVVGDSNERGL